MNPAASSVSWTVSTLNRLVQDVAASIGIPLFLVQLLYATFISITNTNNKFEMYSYLIIITLLVL